MFAVTRKKLIIHYLFYYNLKLIDIMGGRRRNREKEEA